MLTDMEAQRLSKFLSLVLRHKPDTLGITLNEQGWTDVDILLATLNQRGYRITREQLTYLVETNNKKRFTISQDERQIRAN